MDRLPPWDQLTSLRTELDDTFQAGPEERKRRKPYIIDEILDMLIIAYLFGNEAGNTMLYGTEVVDTLPDGQISPEPNRVIDVDADDMNRSVFKVIAGKNWEQRVSEYLDDETGTVDDIIRVVDTDMNRIYNDSVLDVGEKANAGRVEWTNEYVPAPDTNGKVMKTWVTMADERVRETHQSIEGVTIPIDKRFYTIDGDSARYPGDFSLPQNVVGCRCRIELSMA